jgi:asparaginyl-tRNA synthetase
MKQISLAIEGNPLTLDFNQHFANLVKVNESLNYGAYQNYKDMGLTYVDVPEIVGITGACENIDTLFSVCSQRKETLFFSQTGQLSLEQSLQSFPGVFTVIHSGRDEINEGVRHLRQFRLTEEEFDCSYGNMTRATYDEEKMFDLLLVHIQKTVQSMIREILENNREILEKVYHRDVKKLDYVAQNDFLRIEYRKAVQILKQHGFPELTFGEDLKAHHEAKMVEILNAQHTELPVFITKYPKEIKFFNMKVSETDPEVVLSADLIFPYAGEGTGSAVREHQFEKLNNRLLTSKMFEHLVKRGGKYEDFVWYLDIIKEEISNPHAGYGIGNERVLQYIFGEGDIRNVSLFSLLKN